MKVNAQVVNGECPTCQEITVLVGLTHDFYRCMNCGADLEQHVNGKISYLPIMNLVKMVAHPMLRSGNEKS